IYMSPEQGMGTTIDARTDIYSLGVVMYEALTGEVPFLGRNYVETMTMQISEPPAPFSDLVPDMKIPAALEMIVFRALQKAPDERYQSMTEMKSDLEKALNTGQVRTPESTGSRPVWGFVKKKVEKTIAEEKAMAVPLSHPEPESEDEITKHIIRGVADPDIVSAAAPQIQDFHPGTAPEPSNQENSGSKGEEARQRHKNLIQKTTPTIIESFIESFQPDYQAPTEQEVKARSGGPEESDKTKPEIQDSRTPKRLRAQTRSNRTTGSQRMPRDTSTRNKRSRQSEKPSIFKGLFFKIMVIAAVAGIAYGVLASPELQQALVDFIYKTDWGEKPGSQESLD
ncbi:MAG: hypothetical protein K8F91_05685, partial [Candidatus Obscuribacterales bacterium]|nr:hypothetical protein [Candidatus Obscuribacterales bacterium]